ncbi:hypothetical protein CIL03_13025 [Virgibacillus indicus]|uniref:Permease n=1 Tax=Virgibacillus indicus TaxID=2024554 RepID=A0A265N8B7_9BACI|nr:hypothetical protein [Virgibacillus indicus]OZU88051.1 hypothetical protein CIL03_13025 [Virgibacillus indicus]
MQTIENWGLRISIVLYTLLHFISYYYPNKYPIIALMAAGFVIFVFAVGKRRILRIKMPFGLFLAGTIIFISSGHSLTDGLFNGFLEMRNIIGLLVVIPMISWVLREEPYIESVMSFAHHLLDTSRKFYFGMIFFTQIISYFLLFGSITMMYQFVNGVLKNEEGEAWEHYKGTAILRGFALSSIWVLSIPSFAFVIEVMDASLGLAILQGAGISLVAMIIALVFSHFEGKRYNVDFTAALKTEFDDVRSHTTDKQKVKRNVIEFIILFLSLFGSILFIYAFVDVELLVLIPLVVLVWMLVYYMLKRKTKLFTQEVYSYVTRDIDRLAYQISMMLAVGILIFSLNQTAFAEQVVRGIYAIQEAIPFLNVLYFLPFIIIILGFFGLGPLTVMVLVGGILESIPLNYPPEVIVLAITSGSAISILLSPLIMPLIVLSSENGLNAFKNGIRFNWKYASVLYVMVQVYVQLRIWGK